MLTAFILAATAACPYDPAQFPPAREIRAQVSRLAETVAPSAASGKRRSVGGLPIVYPANRNFIDEEIFAKMKVAGIRPAPRSSDTEFLRRITLDLAGRIPTPSEVREFLADNREDKRDRAIDRLLDSDDFNDRWTLWYGDLIQNTYDASDVGQGVLLGVSPYYKWIRAGIAGRKPYDAMARELLTSSGQQYTSPAANYFVRLYQENGPPQDTLDNVATQSGQQFLAVPMNCVSCHDGRGHLELLNFGMAKVKRRQLWELAAFFASVSIELRREGMKAWWEVGETSEGGYRLNTTTGNKSPRQPAGGEYDIVFPRYLTGEQPAPGEPPRAAYARMLTADPQFARAAANYLWKEMFGLGIVEPVNNFDTASTTQATHPALLEKLSSYFAQHGFDLRVLLRLIAQSNAYQLSMRYEGPWSEASTPYFARRYPRRMLAEEVLDAIYNASGRQMSLNVTEHGPVTKAVATPDPDSLVNQGYRQGAFLVDFGQGDRDSIPRSGEPTLIQILTMLNDALVLDGTTKSSLAGTLAAANTPPAELVEQLYVATLSRLPAEDERAKAIAYLNRGPLADRAADLQFVLLNKLEFLFY